MVSHPAKYSDVLLPVFVEMLKDSKHCLDPFAGTGKIFQLNENLPDLHIDAVEIEPEWANLDKRITLGNALSLGWPDNYFDSICTSPSYGNAMAGKVSKDIDKGRWKRIKYADSLHRNLSTENSANFMWGEKYRKFHGLAWKEAKRVLIPSGIFVLNIKNHIRKGVEQCVTEWHIKTLEELGFILLEHKKIPVPSMKFGKYSDRRVECESVIKFVLAQTR